MCTRSSEMSNMNVCAVEAIPRSAEMFPNRVG